MHIRMKCSKCRDKAIISYPVRFCKKHFIDYYINKVKKTIKKWNMFSENDKILVAVSGGKDSSSLAYSMYLLGYKFEGLYINLEIPKYSDLCEEKVKELFKMIKMKINIIRISEYGVKVEKIGKRPVCSVCGTIKRYLMNKFAYENGFNVLATAHTSADESSFFFMNLRSGDLFSIAKQKPVLPGYKKLVKKVKPLIYITEKENLMFSIINNLPLCRTECPYAKNNTQLIIKRKIYEIDREFKNFIIPSIKFLEKIEIPIKESEIYDCYNCGYPTSKKNSLCSFCKIKEYFSKKIS